LLQLPSIQDAILSYSDRLNGSAASDILRHKGNIALEFRRIQNRAGMAGREAAMNLTEAA